MTTYSSRELAKIAGVTYRQVDYWTKTGILDPAYVTPIGNGRRRFHRHEVTKARVIAALIDRGVALSGSRLAVEALTPRPDDPAIHDSFLIVGDHVVVTTDAAFALRHDPADVCLVVRLASLIQPASDNDTP